MKVYFWYSNLTKILITKSKEIDIIIYLVFTSSLY